MILAMVTSSGAHSDLKNRDKGEYQGFRSKVVEVLLATFDLSKQKKQSVVLDRKALIETKRGFVSKIRELVKPSRVWVEFNQLAEG